jgi:hypothetical protein
MYFFGAQAETGVLTDYIATTSAAVSVGPVSGLPRLDYLGSTCPRLLLEPQRSNLLLNSENYSGSNWVLGNSTVTVNQAVSPDGYTNADFFKEDSTNNFHRLFDSGKTISTTTTYTSSVFVKNASGTRNFRISFGGGFGEQYVTFNINNGTIVSQDNATGVITPYGNGWYRCSATATSGAVANVNVIYWLTSGNSETYLGNGTSGVYLYGSQLEAGAYATSYIPTLGTSVTRVADAASKTGISSLIGQTEGTIFWEGSGNATVGGADLWMAAISVDNTNVAVLVYYVAASGTVNAFINNGTTSLILDAPMTLTQNNKVAVAYKNASFALYLNGALVDSSSSAIAPPTAMNQFAFVKWVGGANQDRALVKQTLLFKTRLPNESLAELTSL